MRVNLVAAVMAAFVCGLNVAYGNSGAAALFAAATVINIVLAGGR